MSKYTLTLIIRGFLTGIVLVFVFHETGIATTIFALLVAAGMEIMNSNMKKIKGQCKC